MEKLPEWPERISYAPDNRGAFLHQRAIAEYWESRCRVAVPLLEKYNDLLLKLSRDERFPHNAEYISRGFEVARALEAIGPLPEPKP